MVRKGKGKQTKSVGKGAIFASGNSIKEKVKIILTTKLKKSIKGNDFRVLSPLCRTSSDEWMEMKTFFSATTCFKLSTS